ERGEPGALTEAILVPERCLVPKPDELSWAEAACLPTAYLTAYRMITTKARLASGARMLVQGVGGGVATASIVLGRALGIEVHATGRTPERRAQAEALGATPHEPGARLPTQVDAVIETVGAATWGHSLRSLRTGGCIVVAGATTGGDPPAELARVFWRGISIHGTSMGTRAEFVALLDLLVATGVRPVIDSVHPLAEVGAAFARLDSGEAFGKVVVSLAE
ncbi:MAG: zinc-binding dehydrogenase, partial [Actinobacteria bacterium]|nr:zinc-binding dehydrogenase [Actinomycetota bacterium]